MVISKGAFLPSCHPQGGIVYKISLAAACHKYSIRQTLYVINYVKVYILIAWQTIKRYCTTDVRYDCTENYVILFGLQKIQIYR